MKAHRPSAGPMTTYASTYRELLNARIRITIHNQRTSATPFEEAVLQATVADLQRALKTLTDKPYKYSLCEQRTARIRSRLAEMAGAAGKGVAP